MKEIEKFKSLYNPQYPLASNNIKRGCERGSREKAFGSKWIETTAEKVQNLFVLDVDYATGIENPSWHLKGLEEDGIIPEPSFTLTNPLTGNVQAGFFIEGFASTDRAKGKLNKIESAFVKLTGADFNYGGRTMRNPLHGEHSIVWGELAGYKFAELEEFIKNTPSEALRSPVKRLEETGGRNTDTFNSTRLWAYKRRWTWKSYSEFEYNVIEKACEINSSWGVPLPYAEVKSIGKSIAAYTWKKLTPETFSKIQTHRANKRWNGQGEQKNSEVLAYLEAGFTRKEIASSLGISFEAAKSAIRRAKKTLS
jgi:hypothetical protein